MGLQKTRGFEQEWDFHWPVQTQSMILSAVISDGLGRIGKEYDPARRSLICRHGWCSIGPPQWDSFYNPILFNGTVGEYKRIRPSLEIATFNDTEDAGRNLSEQLMYSFPQPPDYRERWTQISLQVNRYGYGWGFNSKVVKAAAAILIIHAIIIIAHCCYIIITGLHYSYADSVGELVALALQSQPPKAFESFRTGMLCGRSAWLQPTAVRRAAGSRDYEQRLEIAVGAECSASGCIT